MTLRTISKFITLATSNDFICRECRSYPLPVILVDIIGIGTLKSFIFTIQVQQSSVKTSGLKQSYCTLTVSRNKLYQLYSHCKPENQQSPLYALVHIITAISNMYYHIIQSLSYHLNKQSANKNKFKQSNN